GSSATMGSSRSGLRAVRLCRLNPGLMRRLDEARLGGDSAGEDAYHGSTDLLRAQKQASGTGLPFHKGLSQTPSPGLTPEPSGADGPRKWPLCVPPSRPPLWDGLDSPQSLSSTRPSMAQPGGQRRHLGQRRLPGELQGPFEREKQLLEGYGHLRFGGGHLPPGPAAAAAAATARCDEMHQFEALQQRCLELEGLVGQLKLKRTG
ncbi:unnamed protein product, partial [Polarella glacialis]